MISYAISLASVGSFMTPELAAALRKSPVRNVEVKLFTCIGDSPASIESTRLIRELIVEKVIKVSSVHLPFHAPTGLWDPSLVDESLRRTASAEFAELIENNHDMLGANATLHASREPASGDRDKCISQLCKTLEELIPTAEKYNFSINVEFLPRQCIGNSAEELQRIVSHFDPAHVGICMDINHIMDRHRELPDIITGLAPRIRVFHISDYDGVDECHWMPGQGLIDFPEVMRRIKAIDHDVVLILETAWQLSRANRKIDPYFALKQCADSCYYLENCEKIVPGLANFKVPGNDW